MLLVKQGLSSKHIARELGISHRTVDQHIAAALETLGARNRIAAISELYRLEAEEHTAATNQAFMLREAGPRREIHVIGGRTQLRLRAILPPMGGAINTASRSQRVAWMARIAILCTMLTSAFILAVMAVSEMASAFDR
jgi:biotin operon repressor